MEETQARIIHECRREAFETEARRGFSQVRPTQAYCRSVEEAEREKPRRARGSDDVAGIHESSGPGSGRSRRAGEEQAAGVTVELARAVRLVGASRSACAGHGYDNKPVSCGVGPRCQAAMKSHGMVQRLDQRPSIRRPRP